MTAPRIVDPAAVLGQALSDASPDLMRHLLATVINSLLSAEDRTRLALAATSVVRSPAPSSLRTGPARGQPGQTPGRHAS